MKKMLKNVEYCAILKKANGRKRGKSMKTLETKNLILRKFFLEDAEYAYQNWAGVKEIAEISDFAAHKNIEETKKIIQAGLGDEGEDIFTWAIVMKEANIPVGFVRIYEAVPKDKICKLTWTVEKKLRHKGISNEAIRKVMEYMFEKKGFELIVVEYFSPLDELSKPVLEELGMKKEAELRQRKIYQKTGEKINKIIYSITKEEYEEDKKSK